MEPIKTADTFIPFPFGTVAPVEQLFTTLPTVLYKEPE